MISEGEVPAYLDEFLETALTHMEEENFTTALSYLNKSEELLEAVAMQGGAIDLDYILLTLHNTACCHQR